MTVSEKGIALIKSFEGCRLHAYQDSVGVWTIGFGETLNVKPGMVITQEQADRMLEARAKDFAQGVMALVKVPLNQNQLDALTSFAYNVGLHNFRKSTMLRILNEGDPIKAAAQFGLWTLAGGQALPGLVKRRQAEKALFLTPVVVQ